MKRMVGGDRNVWRVGVRAPPQGQTTEEEVEM